MRSGILSFIIVLSRAASPSPAVIFGLREMRRRESPAGRCRWWAGGALECRCRWLTGVDGKFRLHLVLLSRVTAA